jgi:signal transduction histidine kinase
MTIRLSRLALLLALSTILTAMAGVAATYFVAKDEFRGLLDDDLETQSRLLSEILASGAHSLSPADLGNLLGEVFDDDDEDAIWVSVYNLQSGELISNLEHDLALEDDDSGSIELELDGHSWHGEQRQRGQYIVQLLRRDDYLEDVQDEVIEDIATPVLVVGGINLLLLATFLGMVLRPVARLSQQLETRNSNSLTPLGVRTSTYEIAFLRDTMNKLIRSVDDVLNRERQFANDVAHELRTPLTTLKLELASADPDLPAVKFEINRLSQLVNQMLTLARVEQGHMRQTFENVDLEALCEQELDGLSAEFAAARMSVHKELSRHSVSGDKVLLAVLVRNLLLNVLRHCQAGSEISVALDQAAQQVRLSVADNGPGIEPARREALNAGHSRLDSRSSGHGLGLAICRKIADVHGASLSLLEREDGADGLLVRVVFPT